MSRTPPAVVRAAPGQPHLVSRWRIPIRINGQPGSIIGRLDYVPRPEAWVWWGAAVALALTFGALAWRVRTTLALTVTRVVGSLAVAAGATLAVSQWRAAPSDGLTPEIGSTLLPVVAATLWAAANAIVFLAWLWSRRTSSEAEWVTILMGAWVVGGGALFGQLADFQHAIVPSTLPSSVSRVLVVGP